MSTLEDKAHIRTEMLTTLAGIQGGDQRSEDLLNKLIDLNVFEKVQFVSVYISFPEEINTMPIAEYCWSKHIVVCVPEFTRHQVGKAIVFREWVSDAELEEVHPRLFHPKYGPLHRHEEIDLIIVPGLAFTEAGLRLGRGKGFYDQLLSQTSAPSVGICFAEQIKATLPFDGHDMKVSRVVSA